MGQVLLMNPPPTNLITKGGNMKTGKHWKLIRGASRGSRAAGNIRLNPYPMYMGMHRPGLMSNPVAAIKQSFVHPVSMDNLYDFVSAGAGAIGTYAIPTHKLVGMIPVIGKYGIVKTLLGNAVNMTVLATAAKMAFKNKPGVSRNVMVGGGALTIMQLIGLLATKVPNVAIVQKLSPVSAMAGLGAGNDALRAKVEEAVKRQLSQPESASMVSTVDGRPESVTAFKTVGQPKSTTAYSTVGDGDGLTEDNLN